MSSLFFCFNFIIMLLFKYIINYVIKNIIMADKKEWNIDSTNIFDEFTNDEKLKKEVKITEFKQSRGSIYYLNSIVWFLKTINLLLIIFIWIFYIYSYVQWNEKYEKKSFLTPFCQILQNEKIDWDCSSVSFELKRINLSIKKMEENYYKSILWMVWSVYELSNFAFSKEVLFLLNKSDNRLKPLKIIKDFDNLKNKFESINKSKLKCSKIDILANWTLSLDCEAFSSQWEEKEILWASWKIWDLELVSWSSISYASSFINYIEKTSENFEILDKPRKFSYQSIVWNYGFTRKTSFKLILKQKDNNIWILK